MSCPGWTKLMVTTLNIIIICSVGVCISQHLVQIIDSSLSYISLHPCFVLLNTLTHQIHTVSCLCVTFVPEPLGCACPLSVNMLYTM